MRAKAARPAARLADVDRPLVLTGPPRALRGEVRVANPTAARLVVRQPVLRTAVGVAARPKRGARSRPLPEVTHVLRRIVVRPGRVRPVPIALALDPRTPPGTYSGQLEIDGEQRPVVVHVTEDVSLTVTPQDVVLPVRPGARLDRRVVFANDGNVPVSVGTIGAVVLDDELAHCRALRGALEDAGAKMKGLDDFAVALGRRYQRLYRTLALRVQNEATTIAPGETRVVDLRIAVPEGLDPRSRYHGYAAVSTGSLSFTLVPE